MHVAAADWVKRWVPDRRVTVLECGGRNVNGGVRHLFDAGSWTSVDLSAGPDVDVVADFCDYQGPLVDVVVCCEVAEHTRDWPTIVWNSSQHLTAGGVLIFTAAGPGREPHSAIDGGPLQPGEHYENVDPSRLSDVLRPLFSKFKVDTVGPDVRAVAWR